MKKANFYLILLSLFIPLLVGVFKMMEEKPLEGAFENQEIKTLKYFTWTRWFDERFQKAMEKTASQNTGFRNTLIRIANQINFSIFKSTEAEKVIVGKENVLFEEGYIIDYLGRNYCGEEYIKEQSHRIKRIQDEFLKQYNIHLIMVFEPGKASVYPEKIGREFRPEHKTVSNYEAYSRIFKEQKITNLDLNAYFKAIKDTCTYPLFPAYGVHWSTYGLWLATDTLLKFIKTNTHYDIALPIWKKISYTDSLKDVDFDIEKSMNLLYPLKHEVLAYPTIIFDTLNKQRPKVLSIADSYYWSIFDNKIPHNVFANADFWYYNATVYPDIWGEKARYVKNLNQKDEILKQNVILVMITEMNLYRAFWKFEETAEAILSIHDNSSDLLKTTKTILFNDNYYNSLLDYSSTRNIPFDVCLMKICNFVTTSKLTPRNYISKAFLILNYIIQLKSNSELLKQIKEKAELKKISMAQSIFDDALWCYEQDVKNAQINKIQ